MIVATEEALSSIPKGMREGSLALGATKWQTVRGCCCPWPRPAVLTGLILAMARAAGEVAPLMITGVVKLAPKLPLDGDFAPSCTWTASSCTWASTSTTWASRAPTSEAAKPMVFVTTLVLLVIVILLNITAILLRNRMRKRYSVTLLTDPR